MGVAELGVAELTFGDYELTPLLDGYFIMVGQVPENRPKNAALVVFQSEAEALTNIEAGWTLPEDSDEPKFRYYEIPATGHMFSAVPQPQLPLIRTLGPSCMAAA